MITSPINPMRYWKLEEIQRMLNQIEGYENVVIEFHAKQSDGWNKLNWDCTYGIKEQLVNGQYTWLLKHMFVVEAKTELDAHNLAWQEAAERLITDVWRTSINSFRKQQRELNKPKAPTTLTEDDLKIIDKIDKMYKPKTKQWLRQAWYWVRATLATTILVGGSYLIAEHKTALEVVGIIMALGIFGGVTYCFKMLLSIVFDDDIFNM